MASERPAATTPGPCVFPRCVKGEQPSYCGHDCDVREKPYEHEYGTPADGLAASLPHGQLFDLGDHIAAALEIAERIDKEIESVDTTTLVAHLRIIREDHADANA